eukprot:8445741-Pyramimonas_sp.AAC.2
MRPPPLPRRKPPRQLTMRNPGVVAARAPHTTHTHEKRKPRKPPPELKKNPRGVLSAPSRI